MAYRIEYGPPRPRRREKFPLRLLLLTCFFFVLFLAGVKIFWPEGQARLTQLLLPARNAAGTRAAFRDLLDALRSGQPFYDSLTAFCREIVSYADLPAA